MAKTKYKKPVKNPESVSEPSSHKNLFWIIVFCFSFLLYANTIPNDYNLDDELVTGNHKLTSKGVRSIPEIFTSPYYSDNMGYAFEYRPMVHVTFAIENQFFGDSPHVSHFMNALLYSCLCLLLLSVLLLLFSTENIFLSLLITLLFASHPVHTEVVASIKNRDEMLALFFSLASWYVILKYSEKKLVWVALGGSVLFLMALLSKISVFSFVIIIPLSLLFFQKLPLYKAVVIAVALFTPAFFIINVMLPEFKLLLFAAIALVLYLGYVLNLWLQRSGSVGSDLVTAFFDIKAFLKREVFPFNHRFFFHGLCVSVLLLLIGNIFSFTQTGNYYGMIVLSGLCLLLSIRAKGIFKWLLLLAFQLTLAFMQYLISEQFAYIIFLTWCFFALSFVRSTATSDKLIFGSLFLICIPLSFLVYIYPYRSYLFVIAVSLIPFVYIPAKRIGKYLLGLIVVVLSLGFLRDILEKTDYPLSLVPIILIYLLLAYFPEKLKVRKSWLFVLLLFSHFFFAFTSKINYNYFHQVTALKEKFSETTPRTSETSSSSDNSQSSKQLTGSSEEVAPAIPLTLLPDKVARSVHRPLDFVENPVTAKDPMSVKVASAFDVMLRYLRLLVVPYPLSYYYGYKVIEPVKLSDSIVIISMVIHLLLVFSALYFFSRNKLVPLFGILFYLISILQFTNIFQAVPGMMADRYLLGPSLGFCMVLAYGLFKLLKLERVSSFSEMTKSSMYVILPLLLLYSGLTIARNRDWKDNLTLFRNDIKHIEQSAQAHNLLGLNLLVSSASLDNDKPRQTQLREEAITHFKKAIAIYPEFFNVVYDIGRTYSMLGQPDSSLVYFQMALRIDSTFAEVPINIGEIYFYQQKYREAIPYFEQAMRQQPTSYKGYDKLSYVYYTLKEFDSAIAVNRFAHQQIPGLWDPLVNIGRTYMAMNQADSARVYFEKGLALAPNNQMIQQLLQQAGGGR